MYQICDFRADRKKQDGRLGLWLTETFLTSRLKPLNESKRTLTGIYLYLVCVFSGRPEKQHGHPVLWLAETFSTSSLKLSKGIQQNLTGSLFRGFVFRADRKKNKMANLAYDWLRKCWLLLGNYWTEINETSQDAKSQRPLQSSCFRADRKWTKNTALASD